MAALPLPDKIGQDAQRSYRQRQFVAQFGDGYSQVVGDGLNSKFEEWSLSWPLLNAADRNTVITALLSNSTGYFTWTPTQWGEVVEKKYRIVPGKTTTLFTETQTGGKHYNISVNLVQVF